MKSPPLTEKRYFVPLALITSLFFLWALGVNFNDVLIPHLKKAFRLTDLESSLIQVAFFGGYFLAAWPAGRLMDRIGYKRGILAGLLLCASGALLFIPAAALLWYGFFLSALFVMACGQSFLEVAANPYVTVLGPPRKRRAPPEPLPIFQFRRSRRDSADRSRIHPHQHPGRRSR